MSSLRIVGMAPVLSFSAELAEPAGASEPEMLMIKVDYPGVEHMHRADAYALLYLLEESIVEVVRGGKEVTATPGRKGVRAVLPAE